MQLILPSFDTRQGERRIGTVSVIGTLSTFSHNHTEAGKSRNRLHLFLY
ncbi:hypothetical protein LAZ40_09915 [Cereibacter sphaeroides]|nr:hypothetical protein [Cereibacter sphaeroides]MCE6959367.1 hypothetical protein [Cereibacter sphaeroides]MCE6972959.1 hypothetical protein [Cereibacter sphaeroides]